MTTVIDGVKVLEFKEWEKRPAVQDLYGQIDECDICYGSGDHECDCGDTHDCGACGGSGKEKDIRDVYETMLQNELKKLIAWREGIAIKHPSYMNDQKSEPANIVQINIHGTEAA